MKVLLKWFTELDKLQHLMAGTYIFLLISIDFGFLWAWGVVATAAVGKESLGYFLKKKKFSWEDIAATMAGGLFTYLLLTAHYQTMNQ